MRAAARSSRSSRWSTRSVKLAYTFWTGMARFAARNAANRPTAILAVKAEQKRLSFTSETGFKAHGMLVFPISGVPT